MAKILMIQVQVTPYAGTAYLNGAAISGGHEFRLLLSDGKKTILKKIISEKPDIIGFSCMSGFHKEILEISAEIKKEHTIPIILGGPHPTLFPEIINESCIDMICIGEGEFALLELLNAIEKKLSYKEIKNLCVKENGKVYKNELRPLVEPLDNLPLVDWSCYKGTPVENSAPIAFLIRGCPYSCSYCFNSAMRDMYRDKGKYVRFFSVSRSIKEIKQALDIFSHSPVIFTSDSFGFDLKWMEELFKEYEKITDLPFVLLLRPEVANEKCVGILAKYNCITVAVGVESGSQRVRREILNRHYTNQSLVEVAERLHANKIKFRTYNMIGIPGETEDEMWETVDINIKMKTDYPRGAIFTPMPNTRIVEMAKEQGYLDDDFCFDNIPNSILKTTILNKVNKNVIVNTMYFFQTAVKFPLLKKNNQESNSF